MKPVSYTHLAAVGRILDQCAAAVAAVAAADDGEGDAVIFDGVPVDAALELRDINAARRAVQRAVRTEGVDVALNDLLAGDRLVGRGVVICLLYTSTALRIAQAKISSVSRLTAPRNTAVPRLPPIPNTNRSKIVTSEKPVLPMARPAMWAGISE